MVLEDCAYRFVDVNKMMQGVHKKVVVGGVQL
jgi:hypothetical protein